MSVKKMLLSIELNEPQQDTLARMRQALRGSHHADLVVRKDGQNHGFEIDWLRHAIFEDAPQDGGPSLSPSPSPAEERAHRTNVVQFYCQPNPSNGARKAVIEYFDSNKLCLGDAQFPMIRADHFLAFLWVAGFKIVECEPRTPEPEEKR